MKILLTGATGFIGRAVLPVLTAAGHAVVPAVRRSAGLPGEAVVGGLGPGRDWDGVLGGCDAVVHLAGLAACKAEEAAACHEINCEGTLHLAREAARLGVGRFVFVSSAKVHGEGRERPYREDDPAMPQDAYARSKWAAETGLAEIARDTGLEVVVLRPPLVYGPGARGNFAALARAIQRGLPLPLGALRQNRRSLVSAANLADFIQLALVHPAASNEAFFVSDGEDVSTAELVERMGRTLGKQARLLSVPPPWLEALGRLSGHEAAVARLTGSFVLETAKARSLLGWRPRVSLDAGLREALAAS